MTGICILNSGSAAYNASDATTPDRAARPRSRVLCHGQNYIEGKQLDKPILEFSVALIDDRAEAAVLVQNSQVRFREGIVHTNQTAIRIRRPSSELQRAHEYPLCAIRMRKALTTLAARAATSMSFGREVTARLIEFTTALEKRPRSRRHSVVKARRIARVMRSDLRVREIEKAPMKSTTHAFALTFPPFAFPASDLALFSKYAANFVSLPGRFEA